MSMGTVKQPSPTIDNHGEPKLKSMNSIDDVFGSMKAGVPSVIEVGRTGTQNCERDIDGSPIV